MLIYLLFDFILFHEYNICWSSLVQICNILKIKCDNDNLFIIVWAVQNLEEVGEVKYGEFKKFWNSRRV